MPAAVSPGLRLLLREEHFSPPPLFEGFRARHWHLEHREVRGSYLVSDSQYAGAFRADPQSADPSIWRISAYPGVGKLACGPVEAVGQGRFDRPVFLVSAPRAGSTLLFETLAEASSLWTVGRESEGIIEGIPQLHPSFNGYQSHRLTHIHPDTAQVLWAAFLAELHDRQGQRWLGLPADVRPGQVRMLEKTPENALRIPMLVSAFPDARFIFLIREARQNISSMVEAWQHGGFLNIPHLPGFDRPGWHLVLPPGWQAYHNRPLDEIAAFQWASTNQAILNDLAGLPDQRWTYVDYQALVTNPEAVVRQLCAFMEIPFDQPLAALTRRPLRLSGTTIRPPSPTRWRYNRDFSEQALAPYQPLVERVEEMRRKMATKIQPRPRISPVRFECFLEDLDQVPPASNDPHLIVDPSFQLQMGVTIPLPLVQRARFRERFLSGTPILWVEDPATRVLRPFWVRPRAAWSLRALKAGGVVEPPQPADLMDRLRAAEVLVSPEQRAERGQFGRQQAQAAAAHFAERDFCVISKLLHPAHLRALGRYYQELIRTGAWKLGDDQVAGRFGWYNESLARFFQHQLTTYIGQSVGARIKPSYAYVSFYQEGAVLERHVDREQCEYTVSLLVERSGHDQVSDWPIYFDTPGGQVELVQSVGEAIVFRGPKLPHYRPPLPAGQSYLSLLFHYVPADFAHTLY